MRGLPLDHGGDRLCSIYILRMPIGVEIGPFHPIPGYLVGIPDRTLLVERVGSDLTTRGYSEPAGNDVTGTRVSACVAKPRFIILP